VPARDGASAPDGAAAADGSAIIPPSRRDGGIPPVPPGAPPCAPDSMAGDGKACRYEVVVECTLAAEAGPVQICTCLPPALGGKWYCGAARDGGGVRPF